MLHEIDGAENFGVSEVVGKIVDVLDKVLSFFKAMFNVDDMAAL